MLPAWAVRLVWDDPRRIPYLMTWHSAREGKLKEAVRVCVICKARLGHQHSSFAAGYLRHAGIAAIHFVI
jgi:hypothetical protein